MTTEGRWPQVGDLAVELREAQNSYSSNRAGRTVTINRITQTMVITSDGERYSRANGSPVGEGRFSARVLVPASDPRVLAVRARERLAGVAKAADNLSKLEHKTAEDVVAALANIVAMADANRRHIIDLMRDASKTEQESSR